MVLEHSSAPFWCSHPDNPPPLPDKTQFISANGRENCMVFWLIYKSIIPRRLLVEWAFQPLLSPRSGDVIKTCGDLAVMSNVLVCSQEFLKWSRSMLYHKALSPFPVSSFGITVPRREHLTYHQLLAKLGKVTLINLSDWIEHKLYFCQQIFVKLFKITGRSRNVVRSNRIWLIHH